VGYQEKKSKVCVINGKQARLFLLLPVNQQQIVKAFHVITTTNKALFPKCRDKQYSVIQAFVQIKL